MRAGRRGAFVMMMYSAARIYTAAERTISCGAGDMLKVRQSPCLLKRRHVPRDDSDSGPYLLAFPAPVPHFKRIDDSGRSIYMGCALGIRKLLVKGVVIYTDHGLFSGPILVDESWQIFAGRKGRLNQRQCCKYVVCFCSLSSRHLWEWHLPLVINTLIGKASFEVASLIVPRSRIVQ